MDTLKTGALIRRLRTEHGLTQRELAEGVGVSDKAVRNGSAEADAPTWRFCLRWRRSLARRWKRCSPEASPPTGDQEEA